MIDILFFSTASIHWVLGIGMVPMQTLGRRGGLLPGKQWSSSSLSPSFQMDVPAPCDLRLSIPLSLTYLGDRLFSYTPYTELKTLLT